MQVADIRKKFIDFFALKNHMVIPSSSLVPDNDPTLMFTNSGMVQFKDIFLGLRKESYSRATSVQRCLRAGGKHNDLENVGYTSRHHTFFEMLGNFSFGEYFKREAIYYAWELLTEVFKLPREKLLVTVYYRDSEAFDIWRKEIGLPESKIIRIADNKGEIYASDNFWSMGDTGPCGPSSEIFYDHGPSVSGGPPGSLEENGDRFVEIWNLVFMQFNRSIDGSISTLPVSCVDTGMGLERIAAVLQNVKSNYEIDLFQRLIRIAGNITNCKDFTQNSLKVIADHIRSSVFMVADGIVPGNDGRNYVLRRIIRRAIRHGYQLGCRKPFFSFLVDSCVEEMGSAYTFLYEVKEKIKNVLFQEEERFFLTLSQGMRLLTDEMNYLKQIALNQKKTELTKILPGNIAFRLHDTYGFPLDLTADVCREHGFLVDSFSFEKEMQKQKELARTSGKFKVVHHFDYDGKCTNFVGYQLEQSSNLTVRALYLVDELDSPSNSSTKIVHNLKIGQQGIVVLDTTPFYPESGGQVGDTGILFADNLRFIVNETFKIRANVIAHKGWIKLGQLCLGQRVIAKIDYARRLSIARHHSSTHLLNFALRRILGDHVQQKGSLVDASHLRFDFSHASPIFPEQIKEIESHVNKEILSNFSTKITLQKFDEAVSTGAIALFGEKYGDEVRVVQIGSSIELCGGTHVKSTGEIGLFKILSESGVASGIRRIEAISGQVALDFIQKQNEQIKTISHILNCQVNEIVSRIQFLVEQNKNLEKKLIDVTAVNVKNIVERLKLEIVEIGNIKLLSSLVQLDDPKILRNAASILFSDIGRDAIIVLASAEQDKSNVVVFVSDYVSKKITANQIIMFIINLSGGKGGGRSTMAQAGGVTASTLPLAFEKLESFIKALFVTGG